MRRFRFEVAEVSYIEVEADTEQEARDVIETGEAEAGELVAVEIVDVRELEPAR